MQPYIHHQLEHDLRYPTIMVPIILELLNPKSVIDVGCGPGNFLKVFQDLGIDDVFGVDGSWVQEDTLYVDKQNFNAIDLTAGFDVKRKFDIALCLEVAEHLPEKSANALVSSLCQHTDMIVFSAAVPLQGGQNHINEQPFSYWREKFEHLGYHWIDCFRPLLWEIPELAWWYKQNTFLIAKNPTQLNLKRLNDNLSNAVQIHPDLFQERDTRLNSQLSHYRELYDAVLEGKFQTSTYLKCIRKHIMRKLKLIK
ncbi:methyltransferase domain-containing protein [Phnomibacter ginsenosidimutans]|uniref:Methyltransferase domain-containing protein n=2 Tax=Phnomibacter ginsenosidimutans TaxID=2676868 RepID=A0A6I6GPV1_9BACT|nr:methyltransferase domain-containing protein [Phnomibacter ginsenosidimutans]